MSLESKVNIVGSAKVKRSIYYSDYESFSTIKGNNENMIYIHFRSVFEIMGNSENTIITDFKMGEFRGKPLRWDYEAMKRRENNGITFEQALKMKTIIKMDVIRLLNGRFIEITEAYNIFIDGESNFDYSKENVRKELTDNMKKQIKDGNYMKALKRKYSLLNVDGKDNATRKTDSKS
jgi:hypothetical protein